MFAVLESSLNTMFAVLESSFNKNAFRYLSGLNAMVLDLEISKDTHSFFSNQLLHGAHL